MYKSVILAAGLGTRMMPLTKDYPKPLLPDTNNSLLLKQITFLRKYNLDISVTIGYQKKLMIEALNFYGVSGYIYLKNKGNAFWINDYKFKNYRGPLVVITSDNLMKIDIKLLINEYYEKGEKSIIVSVDKNNALGDKIKYDAKNHITNMKYQNSSGCIASGLQLLNIQDLKNLKLEFSDFHDVWDCLIEQEKLIVSDHRPEQWISVDTEKDLKKLEKSTF